jgi:hypothetical protein
MVNRKFLKRSLYLAGILFSMTVLGIAVAGCATFAQSMGFKQYALDVDGNVFPMELKGVFGQTFIINGETYRYADLKSRPSRRASIKINNLVLSFKGIDWELDLKAQDQAVIKSICPGAPLDDWADYLPNKYLIYYGKSAPNFKPLPPPPPMPEPHPSQYPTLTPEQLQKVELAYEETVKYLEQQGKQLYIRNAQERAAFIQRYQGKPNTTAVNAAKNEKLPVYSVSAESEKNKWPARGNFAYLRSILWCGKNKKPRKYFVIPYGIKNYINNNLFKP